ncbi:hypothetical protein [Rhodococcus sp. 14-2470-1b]|uniref:hypothetical protein n=1 Tax=Rhodococcus sp. 14-2470-1b TaxID=2023149 RepID=UPI001C3DAB94|nr:hypothetical protein [Rhodococcus sp. 14-2470-1b]
MLRAVALVPSPPLLVPELTGSGAADSIDVRAAACDAASYLASVADTWVAIGVADVARRITHPAAGSFTGYGVDVRVDLSNGDSESDPTMPLPALIAGWLRGQVSAGQVSAGQASAGEGSSEIAVDVELVADRGVANDHRRFGANLRTEIDGRGTDWGLLVVADGATTLTPKAPGSYDDRAESVQRDIDDALAAADTGALTRLDPVLCGEVGVGGLAAWQTAAGVVGDDVVDVRTLYRGAPYGVGYFVGTWTLAR